MTEREKKTNWQREDYTRNPDKYKESAKRYRDKNRKAPQAKIRRTHCKRNHELTELTEDNTYQYVSVRDGLVRQCKVCATAKNHKRAVQLRANHLQRKFGITIEQYDAILAAQDARCATCKSTESGGMGSFHVDHCHQTGKIRALLCVNCNTALGRVNDNPELLEVLAAYIRQHRA